MVWQVGSDEIVACHKERAENRHDFESRENCQAIYVHATTVCLLVSSYSDQDTGKMGQIAHGFRSRRVDKPALPEQCPVTSVGTCAEPHS